MCGSTASSAALRRCESKSASTSRPSASVLPMRTRTPAWLVMISSLTYASGPMLLRSTPSSPITRTPGGCELAEHAHQADHRRGAALVAAHARHVAVHLEVGAAGVVGEALAGQQQRALDRPFALILERDHARAMALDGERRARDPHQQRVLVAERVEVVDHAHRHAAVDEGVDAVRGKGLGPHALGLGAAQVAREVAAIFDGRPPCAAARRRAR